MSGVLITLMSYALLPLERRDPSSSFPSWPQERIHSADTPPPLSGVAHLDAGESDRRWEGSRKGAVKVATKCSPMVVKAPSGCYACARRLWYHAFWHLADVTDPQLGDEEGKGCPPPSGALLTFASIRTTPVSGAGRSLLF